ncbi:MULTISPECIES: retropepsin-like aspartic protease family protein [unclassified Tychonema]|uniref:retropepsin-like aspartic protease family protein n=1 Tax=unclassified Tychonema TaxID=2642144 RepID=UPI001D15456F|nr:MULTISPECIES: retropepsin-like aspartic protease [unclassified Tychonema]
MSIVKHFVAYRPHQTKIQAEIPKLSALNLYSKVVVVVTIDKQAFKQTMVSKSPLPLLSNSKKPLLSENLRKPLLLLTAVISLSSSILLDTAVNSSPATAQESEGCFMRNDRGQTISLSRSVCGFMPQELAPAGSSDTKANTKSGVFLVKIKRREANIPVIEVTFNGTQKFEMMVDSGASRTVITPAMATALKIVPQGSVQAKTPNGVATFPLGNLSSIEAGGLAITNIVVPISPALDIGLLGHDFFGNKDVTIKQDVIEFRSRS